MGHSIKYLFDDSEIPNTISWVTDELTIIYTAVKTCHIYCNGNLLIVTFIIKVGIWIIIAFSHRGTKVAVSIY